jgi:hypothetical protein
MTRFGTYRVEIPITPSHLNTGGSGPWIAYLDAGACPVGGLPGGGNSGFSGTDELKPRR